MKILHIDASILGGNSVSRSLSAKLVDGLKAKNPAAEVTYLDLAKTPIGHLSGETFAALATKPEERNEAQKQEARWSEESLADFLAADVIVLGVPMYNFGLPSQLKAWIDRVLVAGKTFRYTEKGPVGMAGGKRVLVASARGGFYGEGSGQALADHQETHLTTVLQFVGISDVTFVRAEGVAISPEQRSKAVAEAEAKVPELV